MSDEHESAVVFRTSQPGEAEALAARLEEQGIPVEIRIAVPADREGEALGLIEAHMKYIGAAPQEEVPSPETKTEDLLPCPNCETPGIALNRQCSDCGFAILPAGATPVSVKAHAPGAKSFCPECRDPLTYAAGECKKCGEELEPLEASDRLCPTLQHVLYRDTVGGVVCQACKKVWVDLAA